MITMIGLDLHFSQNAIVEAYRDAHVYWILPFSICCGLAKDIRAMMMADFAIMIDLVCNVPVLCEGKDFPPRLAHLLRNSSSRGICAILGSTLIVPMMCDLIWYPVRSRSANPRTKLDMFALLS
jgi:hypothetical protein